MTRRLKSAVFSWVAHSELLAHLQLTALARRGHVPDGTRVADQGPEVDGSPHGAASYIRADIETVDPDLAYPGEPVDRAAGPRPPPAPPSRPPPATTSASTPPP
jgi:hypothetical protein